MSNPNSRKITFNFVMMKLAINNHTDITNITNGAEIWGGETVQQLESLQLQYYKRVFDLHQTTHSQIRKGDLGLFL